MAEGAECVFVHFYGSHFDATWRTPAEEKVFRADTDGMSDDDAAIAIYSAAKHRDSFEDAIVSCVNHSGDSDSTGAICGNIMGALLGRSAIPAYYTENLELLGVIEEMATDIYTGCIISEYDDYGSPEKERWDMKYCCQKWTPQIVQK